MHRFNFGLLPRLREIDWSLWEQSYPRGVGASAFSSPAWQRLMQKVAGPDCRLRALVGEADGKRFSLPVFVRQWRHGRVGMVTQPVAYFVLPVECTSADSICIGAITAAARTPLTSHFTWWLPPWLSGDRSRTHPDVDTYVIELDTPVDDYLQRSVRKRYTEYVRSSYRRGIEVIEHPNEAEINEYYALYDRTYAARQWVGDKFSRDFFEGVANSLGDAGRLLLLRHKGRIVGGGVILFDRYAAHYFQGATERDSAEVKPHMVMYDWLLRAAAERGLKYVNLGGVNDGNRTLAAFKRQWGARPVPIPHVSWSFDPRALARRLSFAAFTQRA